MTDGPNRTRPRPGFSISSAADSVASSVLAAVAVRTIASRGMVDAQILTRLQSALLEPERAALQTAVREMQGAGIRWDDIVDHYIPAAARLLGERWCEDEVSFADVTIGSARLQSMLRDFAPEDAQDGCDHPLAPSVLLVVREDDYHTLGAMVAAAQLRRNGVSVRLSLGRSDKAVAALAGARRFEAIMISASIGERLESVRNLVKSIRQEIGNSVPVVVGGSIVGADRDVRSFTDADHTTTDPREALRLCGLKTTSRGAIRTAKSGNLMMMPARKGGSAP